MKSEVMGKEAVELQDCELIAERAKLEEHGYNTTLQGLNIPIIFKSFVEKYHGPRHREENRIKKLFSKIGLADGGVAPALYNRIKNRWWITENALTIGEVRRCFWISKLRQVGKKTTSTCAPCQKIHKIAFKYPDIADLPLEIQHRILEGGIFERLIRIAKESLHKAIGKRIMIEEELRTMAQQAEENEDEYRTPEELANARNSNVSSIFIQNHGKILENLLLSELRETHKLRMDKKCKLRKRGMIEIWKPEKKQWHKMHMKWRDNATLAQSP